MIMSGMVLRNWLPKVIGFILLGLLIIPHPGISQIPQQKLCKNPDFEKEIRSYLSFTVPIIGVSELKSDLQNTIVLDAREQIEYNTSHIPGALYIGYDKFNPEALQGINKNEKIVIYCSIGYRSEKIAEKLKKMGYNQVFNLFGSIFEWANQDYPLVDSDEKTTFTIHTYNRKWSKWVDNENLKKKW